MTGKTHNLTQLFSVFYGEGDRFLETYTNVPVRLQDKIFEIPFVFVNECSVSLFGYDADIKDVTEQFSYQYHIPQTLIMTLYFADLSDESYSKTKEHDIVLETNNSRFAFCRKLHKTIIETESNLSKMALWSPYDELEKILTLQYIQYKNLSDKEKEITKHIIDIVLLYLDEETI